MATAAAPRPRARSYWSRIPIVQWYVPFTRYKAVATAIWFIGVWMTWLLVIRLGGRGWSAIAIAVVAQAVLTVLEGPVWKGQHNMVSWVAVMGDTGINATGLLPVLQRIDTTRLDTTLALALPIVASLTFGFIAAKAPEEVWSWSTLLAAQPVADLPASQTAEDRVQ